MKVLVTGGAGYIGSHLVDFLIEKGHEVGVIDNFVSGKRENLNPQAQLLNSRPGDPVFLNYHGDTLDINKQRLTGAMTGYNIVFHLAAVSRTPWAVEHDDEAYMTNIIGSRNVLRAALDSGVKKVVLASSNIVYAAQTPYKTSKLAMEQVARDYNDLYGLPTVCLRFSNVAGGHVERQHPDNVLASLSKSKKEKGCITITGDGSQTRNFTNVNDICEALWLASQSDIKGTELDIMHPKTWELNEIAKMFDCEIKYVDERKGDVKHLVMGIGPDKAKELLEFEAKIGLEEYIKDYTN